MGNICFFLRQSGVRHITRGLSTSSACCASRRGRYSPVHLGAQDTLHALTAQICNTTRQAAFESISSTGRHPYKLLDCLRPSGVLWCECVCRFAMRLLHGVLWSLGYTFADPILHAQAHGLHLLKSGGLADGLGGRGQRDGPMVVLTTPNPTRAASSLQRSALQRVQPEPALARLCALRRKSHFLHSSPLVATLLHFHTEFSAVLPVAFA